VHPSLRAVLGNISGHAAYSGIFGYFIALASMRRRSEPPRVLIGLAVAASLHAAWDAMPPDNYFLYGIAASLVCGVRRLSPQSARDLPHRHASPPLS